MWVGIGVGIGRNRFATGIFNAYALRVTADGGITEAGQCVDAVTGLLLNASLLLIPSGYKGGKLYSEIPTNGNGDLTWTRGSDAFRTNASGLIQRVPWNLFTYSEQFDNVIWEKNDITISANSTLSPTGTTTADKATPSTNNAIHYFLQDTRLTAGVSYTQSVYVKSNGYPYFQITGSIAFTTYYANFDLTNGTLGASDGGTAKITNVGDGWFRLTYTLVCTTTTTAGRFVMAIIPASNSGRLATFAGDGTSGIYIWGAQLVEGTTAQTYLPTTDRLNFPRLSYMYGSCPAVLLEPQRTNVVLWSSDLSQSVWSKTNYALSSATAIQGLTATRITKNATNNGNYGGTNGRNVINTVGTFAAGVKTFSVLLRKGNTAKVGLLINGILVGASTNVGCEFDFSSETFTNVASGLTATFEKPTTDVYRLILVCNETGTGTSKNIWIAPIDSSNNTVTDGYVDVAYFQWELGAYPTTYIPTTTATATRVADSFSRNNIFTNGLISASGGTWFVELRNNVAYTRDGSGFLGIGDTSALTTNSLVIFCPSTSSRLQIAKFIATVGTTLYTTTTDTVKIAVKWNGTSADVFANGTKVVSATLFTTTNMEFLQSSIQVPTFIQQMALFPTPLSDTDCQLLTAL